MGFNNSAVEERDDPSLFSYVQQHLDRDFSPVRVLKEESEARILLLRHSVSGQLFVLRDCAGNPELYRRLMTVESTTLKRSAPIPASRNAVGTPLAASR